MDTTEQLNTSLGGRLESRQRKELTFSGRLADADPFYVLQGRVAAAARNLGMPGLSQDRILLRVESARNQLNAILEDFKVVA